MNAYWRAAKFVHRLIPSRWLEAWAREQATKEGAVFAPLSAGHFMIVPSRTLIVSPDHGSPFEAHRGEVVSVKMAKNVATLRFYAKMNGARLSVH